jgi:pilus assembly protein CpaE
MDAIRVVLIDPLDESREKLQRLLQGLDSIWLAEVCKSYVGADKAVADQAPDLVVINLDADHDAALALLGEMTRANLGLPILPASRDRAGDVILRAVRAGARELLTLPADPEELLSGIGRLIHPPENGQSGRMGGRLIVFAGASGGVGCTSLAVNISSTMAKDSGRSVALADFDLLIGSVDALLDIVPDYTLLDVSTNAERLDLSLLKRSMTRHSSGLYVLPRPVAMEDSARIEPESIRRTLTLLKAAYSTVVIDTSKALHASDFLAYEMADLIILVIQMELACLRNTARLLQLLRQIDGMTDRIRVVLNRDGFRECQIKSKKAEETLSLPITWTVPDSYREFAVSRSRGVPIHAAFPRAPVQKAIDRISRAITDTDNKPKGHETTRLPRIAAML